MNSNIIRDLVDAEYPAPVSVNFHLWKPCNLSCRFCYAEFERVKGRLAEADALAIVAALAEAGCRKLNFAGGEPTLCPFIGAVLRRAREVGLVTSLVTNGARLDELLDGHSADLDWAALSVDSAIEQTQRLLGRGDGGHVAMARRHFERLHREGIRTKLNTVVTALNHAEDMSAFVRAVRPRRWKVFQVLPIEGENDRTVGPLLVTPAQFAAFIERHAHLEAEGLAPVAEDNEAMTGSYVMIDPVGRFFTNTFGRHTYSRPILDVGVDVALSEVAWNRERFIARGGIYEW